jgi:uncharacterized protein (DUF342 family)
MKGVSLKENDEKTTLIAIIDPLLFEGSLDPESFESFVATSEYSHYTISKARLLAVADILDAVKADEDFGPVEQAVGELKPLEVQVKIASDQMSASISFVTPSAGTLQSVDEVVSTLNAQGVVKGLSKKRIQNILEKGLDAAHGTEFSEIVAKGLPVKNGKNSYIKALVPNAIDRVLTPQSDEDGKVDMRNLGDIICVSAGQAVAKRKAPTKGRKGLTITGKELVPVPGEWKDIILGANTSISDSDENIIVANVAGQPKFENDRMNIDDTYVVKGVNVGTGNVNYDGAVIVNGDVTENMEIIAKGDVTINGFVESAFIRAGGDIIITQGATGKMNDEDCRLVANGSVFLQHGQGLDIVTAKNLHVEKQLAYSRVNCRGAVTIGNIDNPMGNLFASTIISHGKVRGGTIGAVSGSALIVDFSEGYNQLTNRLNALAEMKKELRSNNANHEIKISSINKKILPKALQEKLISLNNELEAERLLLNWLAEAVDELHAKKIDFEKNARLIANKELFPGVTVKLNKKVWKAEREYQRSRIHLEDGDWTYDPIV